MDLTGLPLHLQRDIEHELNTNPTVIKYRQAQQEYQKRGKYLEAIKIAKMLAAVEEGVKRGLFAKYERVGDMYKGMEKEDIEKVGIACNTIIMLSDIIETQVMEMNQVVKKYHPYSRIEMYDKFAELGEAAKEQLAFMTRWSNNLYQIKFGDVADDLTEIITNKVRKLLRQVDNK